MSIRDEETYIKKRKMKLEKRHLDEIYFTNDNTSQQPQLQNPKKACWVCLED